MSPMERAQGILPSIMDEEDYTSVDRMWCPPINGSRYDHLRGTRYKRKHHYLIAINLRQCLALLPRLLGSVIETIKYLGPEQVVLSIVEGNSDDGTAEVLDLLKDELKEMGVAYFLNHTALNPLEENRIGRLAMLRDMALAPLVQYGSSKAAATDKDETSTISEEDRDNEDPGPYVYKRAEPATNEAEIDARAKSKAPKPNSKAEDESSISLDWSDDPVVIFLNDVSACAEDILELVHQRLLQQADMTCAMDWTHRPFAAFYDVWVSRTLGGSLFFDMPGGSWDHARKLFPSDPVARARFQAHRPFQVFSCWNGATVFTGKPLIKGEVRFRSPQERECFQGEVQLFCKDMWFNGYGKIAVVPSVNLEYSDEAGRTTKDELGYTRLWVGYENDEVLPMQIDWQGPPEKVLCMPEFHRQSWEAWNESLPLPPDKVANPFGQ
jgi:alpha-1,3-mannosyltransferase